MKRELIFLMCVVMAAITANAHDFEVDGIYYSIIDSSAKSVAVTYSDNNLDEYTGVITIPSTVIYSGETYEVAYIGPSAFYCSRDLTSVEIPSSVISIDIYAFCFCSGLTSVTIPNSVTYIGEHAFCGCTSLTSIEIPDSVTYIGEYAFSECNGLTSVEISNSVAIISDYAFYKCSGLTSVAIPSSVTSIGEAAFSDCRSLTSVAIPNSVISIGKESFQFCKGLTSIKIPNSVTSIGGRAFFFCNGLETVEIPNSVREIGTLSFEWCSGLTSVTVKNANPDNISLGSNAFKSVPTSTCILYVPEGTRGLYAAADQWKDFMNIVEFKNTDALVEAIEVDPQADGTFYDLAGRRVVSPTQGVYIHNGQKILVK